MRSRAQVACFAYHEVTDDPAASGFQRPGADRYKLSRRAFTQHLNQIAMGPRRPALVAEVDLRAPGRHLLLTFDDGGRSAQYVSEELLKRGWKGHFFIVTSLVGTRTFLDAEGIRQISSCGHLIGSHSHTHPNIFREQSLDAMVEQWRTSCDALSQLLGQPCTMASVPGGDISQTVLHSAAVAGLRYLFTSEPWLTPRDVERCWVLGRFCPKIGTSASDVGDLARFRGWTRALMLRRLKGLARRTVPSLYRLYVRRMTTPREPA